MGIKPSEVERLQEVRAELTRILPPRGKIRGLWRSPDNKRFQVLAAMNHAAWHAARLLEGTPVPVERLEMAIYMCCWAAVRPVPEVRADAQRMRDAIMPILRQYIRPENANAFLETVHEACLEGALKTDDAKIHSAEKPCLTVARYPDSVTTNDLDYVTCNRCRKRNGLDALHTWDLIPKNWADAYTDPKGLPIRRPDW